jgi:hypothetical protein
MGAPRQRAISQSSEAARQYINSGSYQGSRDTNDLLVWDTLAVSTTLQEYDFFTQPIGSGSTPKTRQSTNMIDTGKMPFGQDVVVKAIGFHYVPKLVDVTLPKRVQAFYTVMEESLVQFQIIGREFEFEASGDTWLPCIAISSDLGVATTATTYARIGDFQYHGWYVLKQPIPVTMLVSFRLKWLVDTSATLVSAALTTLTTGNADKVRWKLGCAFERSK